MQCVGPPLRGHALALHQPCPSYGSNNWSDEDQQPGKATHLGEDSSEQDKPGQMEFVNKGL